MNSSRFLTSLPVIILWLVAILLAALNSSKAILSFGVPTLSALMLVYQGMHRLPLRPWSRHDLVKALLLTGIFWLAVISAWQTEGNWPRDIKSKLHFLAIPLGLVFLPRTPINKRMLWVWIYMLSQAIWSILSLIQFAGNYEAEMERVAQNAHIDIFGSISHIYFSMLLGFSVILGLYIVVNKEFKGKWILAALTLFNFLALHIFSSRTGQLACYVGLFALLMGFIWQQRRYRLGIALLLLLILLPTTAYYTIPSFQTRIAVSLWDYEQYQQGVTSVAENSLSARLTVWKAAKEVFMAHPWLGVGLEDVHDEIEQYYLTVEGWDTVPDALQITHNLYLRYAVGLGIFGLLYLLLLLIYPLLRLRQSFQPLWLSFILYIAVAMLFENILEREIGIVFFGLGYMLIEQEQGE